MKEKKWKMEKFTKIGAFRGVIQAVQREMSFGGYDENKEPIWKSVLPGSLPTLSFLGTEKLHGCNAGISLTTDGEVYAMSRNNIITSLGDNAGFATWVEKEKDILKTILIQAQVLADGFHDDCKVAVYGEWIGKGIQKKVGISTLSKRWVIFAIKVIPNNTEVESFYIDSMPLVGCPEHKIHKAEEFGTYKVDVDFNNPTKASEKIEKLVLEVEKESPTAKQLNAKSPLEDGRLIGEGIVWTYFEDGIRKHIFKSKGKEHNSTSKSNKVRSLKSTDPEQAKKIKLAQTLTHEGRLEQAVENVCKIYNGGFADIKDLGNIIQWVRTDIVAEDMDVILKENFEMNDLNGFISKITKDWFFEYLDKEVGL